MIGAGVANSTVFASNLRSYVRTCIRAAVIVCNRPATMSGEGCCGAAGAKACLICRLSNRFIQDSIRILARKSFVTPESNMQPGNGSGHG